MGARCKSVIFTLCRLEPDTRGKEPGNLWQLPLNSHVDGGAGSRALTFFVCLKQLVFYN